MKNNIARLLIVSILFVFLVKPALTKELSPFFDVHVHYKWDQEEVTSPQQALETLRQSGVKRAVVIGQPADYALKLYRLDPESIIPFFGPYGFGHEKFSWQVRAELVDEARAGLAEGLYKGIGELHLIGGMALNWRRSKVFLGLLDLAREYNVPIMLHSEYASIKPSLSICRENSRVRFLFAHAGAIIKPQQVKKILDACPNVMMDLAARDPWRYVENPITDNNGKLLPDWRAVILEYADRFMLGSDPVWPVDRGISWDEPDSGWEQLPHYIEFHRTWVADLPQAIGQKLLWDNAATWFEQK